MTSTTASSASASAVSPPDRFLCPISLDLMNFPVRDRRTGVIFERATIMEWIFVHGNASCPMTRKPLNTKDLQRDFDLENEIRAWKQEHAPELLEDSDSESDSDSDSDDEDDDEEEGSEEQGTPSRSKSCNDLVDFAAEEERQSKLDNIKQRVLHRREERIRRMSGGGLSF